MDGSVFITIFAGVSVFVIGQIIIRVWLDPVVAVKEALGELNHHLLWHKATVIGKAHDTLAIQEEIKRLSAKLHAKRNAVPFYQQSARIFGLPSEQDLLVASGCLNQICNLLHNERQQDREASRSPSSSVEAGKAFGELEKLLGIRLDYQVR